MWYDCDMIRRMFRNSRSAYQVYPSGEGGGGGGVGGFTSQHVTDKAGKFVLSLQGYFVPALISGIVWITVITMLTSSHSSNIQRKLQLSSEWSQQSSTRLRSGPQRKWWWWWWYWYWGEFLFLISNLTQSSHLDISSSSPSQHFNKLKLYFTPYFIILRHSTYFTSTSTDDRELHNHCK